MPTPEQQNFANLVANTADPAVMTIDNEAIAKQQREGRAAQDAARPPKGPEDNWRGELADLERQLKDVWTETQAQQHADAEGRKWSEAVSKVEGTIKEFHAALATPYLSLHSGWKGTIRQTFSTGRGSAGQLCGCDGCVILKKIEHFEGQLPELKKQQQMSIRKCGAMIQGCKELDKLRPRYRELAKRAWDVEKVLSKFKGHPEDGRFRNEGPAKIEGSPAAHR